MNGNGDIDISYINEKFKDYKRPQYIRKGVFNLRAEELMGVWIIHVNGLNVKTCITMKIE